MTVRECIELEERGYRPYLIGETYAVVVKDDTTDIAIHCRRCGMISHNRHDVEKLYCGNCHQFHEEPGR